jgi:hypothetical protein
LSFTSNFSNGSQGIGKAALQKATTLCAHLGRTELPDLDVFKLRAIAGE